MFEVNPATMSTRPATTATPSEQIKCQWTRLAHWAYSNGHNTVGHRYSMAAALNIGQACPLDWFNALQADYHEWEEFLVVPSV